MQDETIPAGLCQCGCGEKTGVYRSSNASRGFVKGAPKRFVHGHNGLRRPGARAEAFWQRVDKGQDGDCWIWTAGKSGTGYGVFMKDGRKVLAHRFAYELLVGEIPDGLVLDHLCRNHACVNPDHLEPVTNPENVLRGKGCLKTHCNHGHPLVAGNLYIRNDKGWRSCRTCHLEGAARRRERARAARKART